MIIQPKYQVQSYRRKHDTQTLTNGHVVLLTPTKAAALEITQAEELLDAAMTHLETRAAKTAEGRIVVIKILIEGLTLQVKSLKLYIDNVSDQS